MPLFADSNKQMNYVEGAATVAWEVMKSVEE